MNLANLTPQIKFFINILIILTLSTSKFESEGVDKLKYEGAHGNSND